MKKYLIYVLPALFALAFITLVLVGNLGPSAPCIYEKEFINTAYTGIVKQKYEDKDNHNIRTLLFSYNEKASELILVNDTSGYYEYVKVGDTIIKSKNSSYIQVNKSRKFKIYFDCH